jgi:hypothetical protein
LLLSIQVTEKGQESLHGYVIENDTLITRAGITGMGRLSGRNGAEVGLHHGSRKNGEDLFSLECEKSAGDFATVRHLVLEEKVADSLDVVT